MLGLAPDCSARLLCHSQYEGDSGSTTQLAVVITVYFCNRLQRTSAW